MRPVWRLQAAAEDVKEGEGSRRLLPGEMLSPGTDTRAELINHDG